MTDVPIITATKWSREAAVQDPNTGEIHVVFQRHCFAAIVNLNHTHDVCVVTPRGSAQDTTKHWTPAVREAAIAAHANGKKFIIIPEPA